MARVEPETFEPIPRQELKFGGRIRIVYDIVAAKSEDPSSLLVPIFLSSQQLASYVAAAGMVYSGVSWLI